MKVYQLLSAVEEASLDKRNPIYIELGLVTYNIIDIRRGTDLESEGVYITIAKVE